MQDDSKLKLLLYRASLLIPSRWYIMAKYYKNFGKLPNLRDPQTFNEKLQWLKLHDHRPQYTRMVDKYEAKKYVAEIIGEEYIIPTLGMWNRAEDIDFCSLPNQFVLKATHDSGRVIICKDKAKLDFKKAVDEMRISLSRNFYAVTREWPYKNVKHRIIAEQYMEDNDLGDLKDNKAHNFNGVPQAHKMNSLNDYKFFCFNGVPRFFKIDFGRFVEHHANYYDIDGQLLPFGESEFPPLPDKQIPLPRTLEQMIEVAKTLSQGIPFVRVDLYEISGKVYFGELTFYPSSGTGIFTPPEWDKMIGDLLVLPYK